MTVPVTNTPILWINQYLQENLQEALGFDAPPPFFPTGPSTLDNLTEYFPQNPDGVMCVYDRMFKRRRTPFPHIKCEQVMYYFYATAENTPLNMIKIQEEVFRLMDREDESAEEINAWAKNKTFEVEGQTLLPNFYFHGFKVYQLEEARDIVDFGTARTYAGNKIIIDYDYHYTVDPNSPNF